MDKNFNKMLENCQPGVIDLIRKGDDDQKVIIIKEKKHTPRTRAARRKNNFKKNKRKRIIALQGNSYNPIKGYVDHEYDKETGRWIPTGKYVKYTGKSNSQRYLKKKTNKRLRQIAVNEEDTGIKGNYYRRESKVDYWWELF